MIEIITPAPTLDLTTSSMFIDRWEGDIPSDEVISMSISSASRTASLWCRREFSKQEYVEKLSPTFTTRLELTESPVTEIDHVSIEGSVVDNWDIDHQKGELIRTERKMWATRPLFGGLFGDEPIMTDMPLAIEVQYTAGYVSRAVDPVAYNLPADLEEAVLIMAIESAKSAADKPIGYAQDVRVGSFGVKYGTVDSMTGSGSGYWAESIGDPSTLWLPMLARRILLNYRRLL